MRTTVQKNNTLLPRRYLDLVAILPPRAIRNDRELANSISIIDSLMSIQKLSKDQEIYLETLVQLVQVYESTHHAIDNNKLSSIDSL